MIKTKNFNQRIDECMIRLNILVKKFDKILKQSAETDAKYFAILRYFDKGIIQKKNESKRVI